MTITVIIQAVAKPQEPFTVLRNSYSKDLAQQKGIRTLYFYFGDNQVWQ